MRVQPNLIQLEYLWFCSDKIDVFSVMCASIISVLSYLYALVHGDINLFCLMFTYFILSCNLNGNKTTQKIFLLSLFQSSFEKKQFYYVCTANVYRRKSGSTNSTCILYFGDVTFWLCRTSDNSKYFLYSLGL